MTLIANRPQTLKVKNKTVTKSHLIKFNTYNAPVEYDAEGFRVFPFKTIPDLYVQFDKHGEFIYQSKRKDDETNVEWYLPF